jgi:hypothetical protein
MPLNFYELYNLLSENIESNFSIWFDTLTKYAKNYDERLFLTKYHPFAINLVNQQNAEYLLSLQRTEKLTELKNNFSEIKSIIVKVLKEQNLENLNWFSFCLGYRSVKKFRKEDLEMAIEVTKKAIDSGELPKSEIGSKGWFAIGKEAKDRITKYLEKQDELSNREIERRKKQGVADFDKDLVKLIIQDDEVWQFPIKIYYLPRLKKGFGNGTYDEPDDDDDDDYYTAPPIWIKNNKQKISKRHQILCKLGKSTKWCTAQPSWDAHEDYITDDIYIVHENDQPMYQFVSCINSNPNSRQFMDVDDETVNSLMSPIFNLLNKHLKDQIGCYNLKQFLSSVEELEKLPNLENIEFISLNRLVTKNHKNKPIIIKIFEKLLYFIDIGLKVNSSVYPIIHIFEIYLNSNLGIDNETTEHFKKEINKRKKDSLLFPNTK